MREGQLRVIKEEDQVEHAVHRKLGPGNSSDAAVVLYCHERGSDALQTQFSASPLGSSSYEVSFLSFILSQWRDSRIGVM